MPDTASVRDEGVQVLADCFIRRMNLFEMAKKVESFVQRVRDKLTFRCSTPADFYPFHK